MYFKAIIFLEEVCAVGKHRMGQCCRVHSGVRETHPKCGLHHQIKIFFDTPLHLPFAQSSKLPESHTPFEVVYLFINIPITKVKRL